VASTRSSGCLTRRPARARGRGTAAAMSTLIGSTVKKSARLRVSTRLDTVRYPDQSASYVSLNNFLTFYATLQQILRYRISRLKSSASVSSNVKALYKSVI